MPSETSHYATLGMWFESVAQLVEHRPFKALVLGSSPSALTIKSISYSGVTINLELMDRVGVACDDTGMGSVQISCPVVESKAHKKEIGRASCRERV